MSITKKQRQEVLNKSNGKCWYCGCELEKGWHADHFEPIIRDSIYVKDEKTKQYKIVATGDCLHPEKDDMENIVPACAPCNLFKSTHSIEYFRMEIKAQIERVRKSSSGFRIAERMGSIECYPDRDVVFWFERNGK
jgi:5-methylcytosine-specific restriction endonuclease McrA